VTVSPIGHGLGVSAGLDPGLTRELAQLSEQLGYHSLWSNDEPHAAGLQQLASFATGTTRLELAVGAFPLDRHQPTHIAAEIDRLGLDPARLWIGIGAGQLSSPVGTIQRAVAELRELLPERTRVVVAAMRPRLCRVGGAIADAVLLNWMLPGQVVQARQWVQEGADVAGRSTPIVASYVRVALGPRALQRLCDEEDRYRNKDEGHRRHFETMNVALGSVGVAAATDPQMRAGLAPYHSVLDLPIARVLAAPGATSLRAVATAAAAS
jgi:alkanesulfonate monooxygenase SsuD/methylene tetrahydromethanopterin reductase-like flavin-dependent oxidoreductase (luciferase family)